MRVLVQAGMVADGSGGPLFAADVAVDEGRIVAVERGLAADAADVLLDARDRVVAPGFIDLHSHYDAQVLRDPGRRRRSSRRRTKRRRSSTCWGGGAAASPCSTPVACSTTSACTRTRRRRAVPSRGSHSWPCPTGATTPGPSCTSGGGGRAP